MVALMATSKKAYAKEHLPGLLLPVLPPHGKLLTHAFRGDPPTLAGRSGSFLSGVTAPFPWVLVHARFCLCPWSVEFLFSLVLWKSCNQILQEFKFRFPGNSHSLCQISRLGSLRWGSETFTTVRDFLWCYCSPVCGLPTWQPLDLIFIMIFPFLPFHCNFFFIFGCEFYFLWVPVSPCRWLSNN